jgi:hypothetical protein
VGTGGFKAGETEASRRSPHWTVGEYRVDRALAARCTELHDTRTLKGRCAKTA